ncbi:CPBP family intramembrane metalloprotease domain-containing protein [Christiangramia fulva]|uniref:CPBP family intramembrane metalloprotease domain-containing protein n=1 Tax=Christiangramia fulva TaxID=2126553 RepID=A0A2R3Z6B2_9FLAO|nr:CPBP family intramembrane glutamic endopeptidase [Christiangramia fulva]AVR45800.1 CPBP family intramembrane metalloprotease domain-containing protein [Christiangramia fulva]
MFIEQVYKYQHDFWRYLIGVIAVVFGIIIGQIPLTIVLLKEAGFEVMNMTETDMMQALDSNLFLFLMLLTYAVGLGFLFFIVKKLHEQPLIALTTSRKKIDWSRFWFAFGLVAIFIILTTVGDYISNPDDFLWNFKLKPFLILLVISVVLIPVQTSFEEYFFRGYLMQGIGVMVKNRWVPLVVSSVIFGGLHFFNPEVTKLGNTIMIYYIGTGFMLGIMALMDEGLELSLGFHAANNLLTALIVTADWTAFQTHSILKDVSEPSAGWDVLIPVLVVYPIYLIIFAKKYHWNNWKERLFGKAERPELLNVSEES